MACDRIGDFDAAVAAQDRSAALHARSPQARAIDPAGLLDLVRAMAAALPAGHTAAWAAPGPDGLPPDPVFLVGFPRSGTTLVERALAAHPAITASDEYPALDRVVEAVAGYPGGLDGLSGPDLARLRALYWQVTEAAFGPDVRQGRYLDKAPMNIVHLGAVRRLFPAARVIVALRDPRDVCVSCFLQDFALNDAMAHFLTLDGAARFYAAVMDLWRHYEATLDLAMLAYRYEDAVADFEGTMRRLVDFIGEPWDPAVASREARARTVVATPSYRDVGSEVYARSVGRWRHYAGVMGGALPVLAPLVEAFGYPP
ncbi:MAG: sulfotransferase [Hyphomicrobiales bacterium]|nr:sulfotransferase [Hyphomicrobiales bacterium]